MYISDMSIRVAPYFSQAGLARAAGVGRSVVSEAIRRGVLQTVPTIDGVSLIARTDAERWLKERKPGPKPKAAK
jgi:hypothetical protein